MAIAMRPFRLRAGVTWLRARVGDCPLAWSLVCALGCAAASADPAPARAAAGPALASAGASPEPAGEGCPRALALEIEAVSAEVSCLLQRYVQLDTTNPPGNELASARFLERVLAREGIAAEIIESAPGRANLVARLPGAHHGQALLWLHHMDVVAAVAEEWSVPPFSGTLRDGYVYGRGTLDHKGAGVAELVAFVLLRRLGIVPARDVVLLAVADEESGGTYGTRWLTEHRPELFADVGGVLNEGGGVLQLAPDRVVYAVELAQKAPLWLRVTARGRSGHGAAPGPNVATSVLVRALARLGDHEFPIEVLPEVEAMYRARAEAMPEALRPRYRALQASLQDPSFRELFLKEPRDAALVRNTLAITMLAGSPKENVIAESASAVLDMRLLPGQDPERIRGEIESVLAEPSLRVEPILSWRAYASPRDTPLFSAIERLAKLRDPGAPVTANVIGGFTDCNAFRARGITCYGFMPMRLEPSEFERIHGKDERASVAVLAHGVLDLHALLDQLGPPAGE